MADPDEHTILHQEDVEEVIINVVDDLGEGVFITSTADAIADAEDSHALNATFSDTEVEGALDALGDKINAILAALREKNVIDT